MAARYKIIKTTFPNDGDKGYREGVDWQDQGQDEEVTCHNHRTQSGAQRCLNRLYRETAYAANITFFRIVKEEDPTRKRG
jgi:hypothetical protein